MIRALLTCSLLLWFIGSAAPIRAQRPTDQSPPEQNQTDRAIHSFELRVKMYPLDFAALDGLGAAYLQKGRETGDADYYERAKVSFDKSLDLRANDPAAASAMTHMAVACMAEHRFDEALRWAQRALALGSGDPSPWAIAGDALADMGDYDAAAAAYARLKSPLASEDEKLALSFERESRISSLELVAGHTQKALELMRSAVRIAIETHMPAENVAWSEFQLGEELFQIGDYDAAERADLSSLDHYPSYYRALGGLAKVRAAQGKLDDAVECYKKALSVVPFPEYAAALGDVYQKLQQPERAQRQYALVEFIGHLSQINQEIHNRDLAFFYADHDIKLDESLSLARKELDIRRDIYTWDVLAWSLFKNGKLQEAADAISHALRPGTADAQIFFHAGMIYERLGNITAAKTFLQRALDLNPQFHVQHADAAHTALAGLESLEADSGDAAQHEVSRAP
jgi:tetratricopeptide (TPR) repeat protein